MRKMRPYTHEILRRTLFLLTPKLFAKVLTNQRMRIKLPGIMRIFSGEEFCPS